MKATNLADVLRFFDPKKPLSGPTLEHWFIQREGRTRQRLKTSLTLQDELQKILFIGPRGSGKSTELNKLAEEVSEQYQVIGFNALDVTGRTNLEYEDLMLAISTRVITDCTNQHLINRPLSEPLQNRWTEFRDWWQRVVAGLDFEPSPTEVDIGAQISTLLGQIEVGARQSSIARDAIREQINKQMPELIRQLDWGIEQAESYGKRLLIIVEGLDKVDLDSATRIFRDHAPTITAPKATMIYTFPIALRHSDHANTIRLNFPGMWFLPNMPTRHANGSSDDRNTGKLQDLVLARMETHLIQPHALELLVQANGGIPVWLVALMRNAALYALTRDENAPFIASEDAQNAIRDLRRELRATLTRHDLDVLRARHRDRQLTNDADEQRLLYNGSLIDYSNGETWCDAHPALRALLEQEDDERNNAIS